MLQDPGIRFPPSHVAAPLLPEPPNRAPLSRSDFTFHRGSLSPAGTWRLPHPPCPSGVLGKLSVLEPSHLGATSPGGKFLLKQGPGRAGAPPAGEYSPHTPISAPPPGPSATRGSAGALAGSPHPGKRGGAGPSVPSARSRGPPSRGRRAGVARSEREALGQGPRGVARGDRPGLARGLRLGRGSGLLSACVRACVGVGGRLCA